MSSLFASSARFGLRPLSLSQPALARLYRTTPTARTATVTAKRDMSSPALFAAAAVAVGAYVLYTRSAGATAQAETPGGKPPFASFPSFRTLTLAKTENVNHNVKHLQFDLGEGAGPDTTSGLTVTSALLALTFPGGRWLPVLRPYTPINDIDDRGRLDFLVKQYPNGKQSSHLHSLQPGDRVLFFRIPGYSWTANEQAHVGLVAGGQGITPCYQLLRGILRNGNDRTRVTLVWGVNTEEDLILKDELAALQTQYPGRLTTQYVVSAPSSGTSGSAGVSFKRGRVTSEVLKAAGVSTEDGVGKVFFSGPPAMEKALVARDGVLAELGFGKKEMHKF